MESLKAFILRTSDCLSLSERYAARRLSGLLAAGGGRGEREGERGERERERELEVKFEMIL